MPKPKVFIGSSTEQLETARELKTCLSPYVEAKVWDEADFELNESIFGNLLAAAEEFDFGVFVFDSDDVARIRRSKVKAVRDNVVFEFGLFTGKMGRGRTFWVSAEGTEATHIPTDLAGIIHLPYTHPNEGRSDGLKDALQKPCQQLRTQFEKLGPRTDRSVLELSSVRILCAASAEYSQDMFAKDIQEIQQNFPSGSITTAHGVDGQQFVNYLTDRKRWDIIHMAMYVDAETGNIFIPNENKTREQIPAEGIEKAILNAPPRLVVIVTCDSLALASRIARITNTIAGYKPINTKMALNWSEIFYRYLAQGCPLSEAFNRAQSLTDPGLVLLAKHDFRLNLVSQNEPE